jgi:alpha-amylase
VLKVVSVCFYFQVHQPYRLKNYTVFDIGKNLDYFNSQKNEEILKKVAKKCYLPTNNLMLQLIKKYPEFKISYSFSGVILEQLEKFAPEVIESFRQLVKTGNVEILDETYYHSLAFLYSKKEFKEQVVLHNKKIKSLFNYSPKVFRNTELVYNNELAKAVEEMGYKGVLAEGADHILGWRSPNFVYKPKGADIPLLLKNYKLSDDIAFRFSEKSWKEFPLTIEKYSNWVNGINGNGNVVNLFMDYETFGEHQWSSTGIFNFLKSLPGEILKNKDNNFMTPSEVIKNYKPVAELDIPDVISWADVERDLSAWLGNKMQQSSIKKIYELEPKIKEQKNKKILEEWRKLQISDHFYYMCTKWFNDGDVHKYFNPHDSPYEAFINYMNIFSDLNTKLNRN